jgi:hypothetical protein
MSEREAPEVADDAPAGAAQPASAPVAVPPEPPAPVPAPEPEAVSHEAVVAPRDVVFPVDGPAGATTAAAGGAARAGTAPRPRRSAPKGKRGLRLPRRFKGKPGSAAGIAPQDLAAVTTQRPTVRVSCIDYSPQQAVFEELEDLPAFIGHHRKEWSSVICFMLFVV